MASEPRSRIDVGRNVGEGVLETEIKLGEMVMEDIDSVLDVSEKILAFLSKKVSWEEIDPDSKLDDAVTKLHANEKEWQHVFENVKDYGRDDCNPVMALINYYHQIKLGKKFTFVQERHIPGLIVGLTLECIEKIDKILEYSKKKVDLLSPDKKKEYVSLLQRTRATLEMRKKFFSQYHEPTPATKPLVDKSEKTSRTNKRN